MRSFLPHTLSRLGPRLLVLGTLLGLLLGLAGCASSTPYTLGPIKTEDPDRAPIPRPESVPENMYWDRIDLSLFYQAQKLLNLNWTGRQVGRAVGLAEADEADNVNVMDEPPNSSWYTRRHYYDRMSATELARGPNTRDATGPEAGPDRSGPWTVTSGKFEGAGRGFVIEDPRGDRYLLKLDGPDYPELTSSAEVISTKIFYAAGYYVPQNTIAYVDPDNLVIDEEAEIRSGGGRRPMERSDIMEMLRPYPRRDDGTIRVMASKYVDGRPIGPFNFRGTRSDDPNDRVRHEQRRELRGLRVIGSWLNDADRRAANTLNVYTDEKYVKHYLLDMGSTLGANAGGIHQPIHGQAYIIDQRLIPQALLSFGAFRFPWWHVDPTPPYPSVGYFRADVFKPGDWVPTYPNPAMEKATRRDAFWGAKIVMSFRDDDLAAIVETAQMSNPEARAYLLRVLRERRDAIGRYWFDRINPLDRFAVQRGSVADRSRQTTAPLYLHFDDLAVTGTLASGADRRYEVRWYHDGEALAEARTVDDSAVPLTVDGQPLGQWLDATGVSAAVDRVVRADLRTLEAGAAPSSITRVYVHLPPSGSPRVVGLKRL
jgi:hypothetical protein